ncbi:uncharacterized protein [Penaeus vannamei]|uniref:uncharacterized protein n=1 Tax=Penaeus vannamei TaxID=6689 RepID=UPI00387F3FD2
MTGVNVAGLYLDPDAHQTAEDAPDQSHVVFIPLGLGLLLLSVCLRCYSRRPCERKTAVVDPEDAAAGDLGIRRFYDPPPDYEDVASDPPPPLYSEVFRDPPGEGI